MLLEYPVRTDLQDLHDNEVRIAAAFFESPEGKLVTDANQTIVRVNTAFTSITGYSAAETIGKTPHMLASGCHDADFFSKLWQDIQTTGQWQGEILNRKKSGEIYPQWLCIKEIRDQLRSVSHYTSTFSDISASKGGGQKIEPQMNAAATARVALETSMRDAVLKGQFVLHYHPQIQGADKVIGVEALVRWQHPTRGLILPAEFIDIAEKTGLIVPLGQWVLETACTQLKRWSSRAETSDITIAVNVSAIQFHQVGFVSSVLNALAQTGANPCRLKLELTESLLIADLDVVVCKMQFLKNKGIKFTLDDFGTGYSSFLHLRRLPLDELKIDKGFIDDILTHPKDASIAKMMISLASSMGISVIAEGVETEAQRDYLALHDCHFYQGYLFSRPLPIDQMNELLLKTPC